MFGLKNADPDLQIFHQKTQVFKKNFIDQFYHSSLFESLKILKALTHFVPSNRQYIGTQHLFIICSLEEEAVSEIPNTVFNAKRRILHHITSNLEHCSRPRPSTLYVIPRTRRVRQTAIKLQKILTALEGHSLKLHKFGIKCTLAKLKKQVALFANLYNLHHLAYYTASTLSK